MESPSKLAQRRRCEVSPVGVFLLFSSAGVLDSPRTVGILSFSMTSVGSGVSLDSPATVGVFGFGEVGVDGVDGTGFTGLPGVTGEGGVYGFGSGGFGPGGVVVFVFVTMNPLEASPLIEEV